MSQTNSSPIRVRIGSGTFYLTNETNPGTEGWKAEKVTNPQTKEIINRFRKDISVEGTLQWAGMKEDRYKGLVLAMLVKGTEGTYSLEFPMLSTKGVKAVDDYFRSVVGPLQNLKKGDKITMFLNNKNKDKNGHFYKNVIILDENGALVKSNFGFDEVPKWNSTVTKDFTGKEVTTYDPTPTNAFYYQIALDAVEKFKKTNVTEQNTEEQPKGNDAASTPPVVETPKQDLTF